MPAKISISVCIAAYNDENTVEEVIRQAADVLKDLGLSFEVIVVDDASSDRTKEVLAGLKGCLGFLRVLTHETNKGYGVTIKDLLQNSSGEIIFTLPGDLQIPPAEIKKMLNWIDAYDIVIGVRKPRNDPFLRRINSLIYNKTVNILFHTGTTDVNSSKLIKRRMLDNLDFVSDGPFIDAEICAKAIRKDFKIKEVNIEHRKRMFGSPSGDKPSVMWRAFKETISMIGKV